VSLAAFCKFYKLLHPYRAGKFSHPRRGDIILLTGARGTHPGTVLAPSRENARHAGPHGAAGQSRQPPGLSPKAAVRCPRVLRYPPKPQTGILQLVYLNSSFTAVFSPIGKRSSQAHVGVPPLLWVFILKLSTTLHLNECQASLNI